MKQLFVTLLAISSLAMAYAQPKLTVDSRRVIAERKIERSMAEKNHTQPKGISADDEILTIVDFSTPDALEQIEQQGAVIVDRKKTLALVRMKIDKAESLSEIKGVNRISFSREVFPLMKSARVATNVNAVQAGSGIEKAFDGEGVIAGMFDQGIDPNHIAFKDDDGMLRVKGVTLVTGSSGQIVSTDDPDEIADFDTDKQNSTHGTHVIGIMAGGYMGNDFYGVAPKADIYMAAGDFYEYNIVAGMNSVAEYAKSINKPSVVNASIGGNIGAHDSQEYVCRYLDEIVDEYNTIICISSGNEGDDNCSITQTFTQQTPSIQTFYTDKLDSGANLSGSVDIWSKDGTKFTATLGIADKDGNWVFDLPSVSDVTGKNIWMCSSNYQTSIQSSYPHDDVFSDNIIDQIYNGYAYVQSVMDHGRYEFYIFTNFKGTAMASNYRLVIKLEGNPGTTVYCYCTPSNGFFTAGGLIGWCEGSADNSINHLACGNKTLAVGSYCSNRSFVGLDGKTYSYNAFIDNAINGYSSYGTLADGRKLPHIVAPGSAIASVYSRHYTTIMSENERNSICVAKVEGDDYDNYWGMMNGTSMASPFAAGIMVLWKQAFPELTALDAIDIAQQTAIKDQFVADAGIRAGAGKIDALAGIKKVIELRDGVEGVRADKSDQMIMSAIERGEFDVCVAGEDNITVNVYNIAGQLISSSPSINGKAHVVVPAYSGVFVVSAKGDKGTYTRKVTL